MVCQLPFGSLTTSLHDTLLAASAGPVTLYISAACAVAAVETVSMTRTQKGSTRIGISPLIDASAGRGCDGAIGRARRARHRPRPSRRRSGEAGAPTGGQRILAVGERIAGGRCENGLIGHGSLQKRCALDGRMRMIANRNRALIWIKRYPASAAGRYRHRWRWKSLFLLEKKRSIRLRDQQGLGATGCRIFPRVRGRDARPRRVLEYVDR